MLVFLFFYEIEESTIVNCWNKTGILPLLLDTKINDSTFAVQDLKDLEKDDVDKLIVDLTTNLSNLTFKCQLNEFNYMNDSQILTEDFLNEEEIVNIILDEQQEFEEGDASDTNKELPKNPIIEGLNRLTKFINFVEQQKSCDFNIEDLK
ncbi:28857_t:CDS:2, partial [Dentiscutata erythropus]